MTHNTRNHELDAKGHSMAAATGHSTPTAKPFNKDMLTEALRRNFQDTVEEGIPDSLMDLINKLK